MARRKGRLPKWAIKQAGGINKKAWALARRGRGKRRTVKRRKAVKRRRTPRRVVGASRGPRKMGLVGKLNAGLRGLKLGLPALGSWKANGLNENTPEDMLFRYSGYRLNKGFEQEAIVKSAGFYAGNIIEGKVMSALKIPQMAGRKKILAMGGQYLPEIQAVPKLMQGDVDGALFNYGIDSIGYEPLGHTSFIESDHVRNQWLANLGGRVGLGLFSRFVGPMINKHLPKGINV